MKPLIIAGACIAAMFMCGSGAWAVWDAEIVSMELIGNVNDSPVLLRQSEAKPSVGGADITD